MKKLNKAGPSSSVPGYFPLLKRSDCLTLSVTSSSHLVLFTVLHPTAAKVRTTLSKD